MCRFSMSFDLLTLKFRFVSFLVSSFLDLPVPRLHAPDVCMEMCSDPTVWCVHAMRQLAECLMCA